MKMMTKSALALAAAILALPMAASADTTPGWYAGAGAGASLQENTRGDRPGFGKYDFNQPDLAIMGNGGYAWGNGFRTEGEYFRTDADVDDKANGNLTNNYVFANALYDFNMGWMVTPYVGLGVGADWVDATNLGSSAGARLYGDNIKLAYQGIAGVSAAVDENWAVTADYRYVGSFDPRLSNNANSSDTINNTSNNFMLGVRYSFDTPAPVKSTMAPRPMMKSSGKAAVAPIPQTFQVFFDYNKSDLTPEAKRIIASAAEDYKKGGYVRISVTGHTDTKGSDKYNKALSMRRAAAVKAEFASLGIDATVIHATGVGKNGLLVPTNDQVREAQNRRAEIILGKK